MLVRRQAGSLGSLTDDLSASVSSQFRLFRKRLIRQKLSHSDGLLGFLFIPGFVGLLWCLGIRCDLSGCESQVVQVFSSCIGSSLDPVTITTSIGDDPRGTYPFGLEPAPRVVPD
jgi:hypothetical protein